MKILHITSFFHPHVGGSQRYMEELLVHLMKNHPDTSVDVLAYNTDNAPAKETYRDLTIWRIPCWQIIRGRFNLPHPIALISILRRLSMNEYTHIHTHLRFFDTSWWAWIYAKMIGAKSLFTEHVATHPTHQLALIRGISWLVDKTIARLVVPRYDVIMATNQTAADFLTREIKVKKPITIVYGGVDTKQFRPKPQVKKTNKIIVTFVGRLIWTKGVTYLYEAIQMLKYALPKGVQFIFAGEGELTPWLKNAIRKDHAESYVKVLGSVTSEQVKNLLQDSDIVVHPSHHNEGFPNVILEAGSCGCYVIATNVGGTKEIITDGKTGTVIAQKESRAIAESLIWAFQNRSKRSKMARNLREKISKTLDWNRISNVYYKLLK